MSEVTKEEIQQIREAALTSPYDYAIGNMFPGRVIGLCDLALSALDRKWRPIETAPKDGTVVFGINATNREWPCSMVFRRTFDGTKEWADVCGDSLTPTHYIPLPEPPEVKP